MKRAWWAVAAVALAGALSACGGAKGQAGSQQQAAGSVRFDLVGNQLTTGDLATIEIRNVFDTSQVYLIDCRQKNHTLNGQTFCDELAVLPPGIYEVLVQAVDPNCRPERDFYKVVVQPDQTVELSVNLICGGANGGLDVIVTEENTPTIENINFGFQLADGGVAPGNKFYCAGSGPMTVSLTVSDPDDPTCADESARLLWTFTPDGGVPGPTVDQSASLVQNGCEYSFVFDVPFFNNPAQLFGVYNVTLEVTDGDFPADGGAATGGLTGSFTFPIHLLDCGPDAGL